MKLRHSFKQFELQRMVYINPLHDRGVIIPQGQEYRHAGRLIVDESGKVAPAGLFGKDWYVDPNNGDDSQDGKSPGKAFGGLQAAFDVAGHSDRIYCAGGDYTGNYTTPANAVARDVSVIVDRAVFGVGGRAWAGATVSSSPIFTIQARGWRFSGFEFVPGATSSVFTLSGTNANYFQVDNCSTFTGKYFILNAGAHFARVYNNQIVNLNATGSIGIGALSGVGGQYWDIRGNHFSDNYSHINFGGASTDFGLFSSRIEGNTFAQGGAFTLTNVLLDLRGSSDTGGNAVVDNFFDCTKTQYGDDASTAFVRTQARDYGAGNSCNDGVPAAAISS